ncbi:hypothetical protein GOV04_02945 [Candidatus Woesearchaeota archaeon]|nr:hypothetical protein [Candidatus Woesearchaeota archaeon]
MKVEQVTKTGSVDLALDTIKIGKQALVFVNTRRSAEKASEDIAKQIKSDQTPELADKALKALTSPTRQCRRLALALRKGVAFHHAGLTSSQRDLIEENFRSGKIKIIAATPTLAFGLDLPAFRTIIRDVKRFGQTSWGLSDIPVLEYHQMAGRAGRPGKEKFGEAIIVTTTPEEEERVTEKFILGDAEEIYSKLAVEPALRISLLSLIATQIIRTEPHIKDFYERTFWAHQFKDTKKLESILGKVLGLLSKWEFVKTESTSRDFVDANELTGKTVNATLLGRRVSQLYLDPLTAQYLINGLSRADKKTKNVFSLLQLISWTLEMRPLLRARQKDMQLVTETIVEEEENLYCKPPTMYDFEYQEYLDSVKTTMFFNDWINEQDEEYLLENYDIRPGEVRSKIDTADWILYSLEEIAKLQKQHNQVSEIIKLRLRLKHGAKEELLALLQLRNIGRVRARKMYSNNIKTLKDVKKVALPTLQQLLGKLIALDIKEQVGDKTIPVKTNKRKGQKNIQDYKK